MSRSSSSLQTKTRVPGTRPVILNRRGRTEIDRLATEEPLEIRVNGRALAVLMRTPLTHLESDLDLVAGFLASEGVVDDKDDFAALGPCTDPNRAHRENVVIAQLASGIGNVDNRLKNAQRELLATGSCGICGKTSIDHLLQNTSPISPSPPIDPNLICELPQKLRARQPVFEVTGGLHGAAIFDRGGHLVNAAEDIGRHNAVDKVIGQNLRRGRFPLETTILVVSSRAGFEIIQKALTARISAVVALGSASSLAHDLASAAGLQLYSFVRSSGFNHHLVSSTS